MEITKITLSTPKQERPKDSKFELWDHQKRMITRCMEIENKKQTPDSQPIGIIADKPGTGKTFVALSLILNDLTDVNLIVVPHNIFKQWDEAIMCFCDVEKIRYKRFTTYADITEIYRDNSMFKNFDIILTTSLYYHLVSGVLFGSKRFKLNRVIFDEIDTINNMIREPIQCKFIWFISASFKENKVGCYELTKTTLNENICLCEKVVIDESLRLELPLNNCIPCYNLFIEIVKDILPPKTISELNALDFNTNTYKFVTKVPKNEKEYIEYLFQDLIEIIIHSEVNINNLKLAKKEMENSGFYSGLILQQKNKFFLEQISLAEKNIHSAKTLKKQLYQRFRKETICPYSFIHLENGNKLVSKCCKMGYSKQFFAINKLIKNYCNFCDKELKYPIDYLEEKRLLHSSSKQLGIFKFEQLKQIIIKTNKQKNIVFSDYPSVFKHLEDYLNLINIEFITLDGGSIESLNKSVEQYKYGSTCFLLVDSSMNGCGMNFENTDNIIFIHKTNPELETQVIGRAQRPGRKSRLVIYRLLHQNEI